jgi:hypothetical protein
MNFTDYTNELRATRGKLTNMGEHINNVWIRGTKKFIEWSLNTKYIGVKKMADIAYALSPSEQDEFVKWCYENKPTKKEIDVKLMEY